MSVPPANEPPLAYPDLPEVPPARARVTRDVAAIILISLALIGAVGIAWTVGPRVGGLATCALLLVAGVATGYDPKE